MGGFASAFPEKRSGGLIQFAAKPFAVTHRVKFAHHQNRQLPPVNFQR
jgi:hypothetical protein